MASNHSDIPLMTNVSTANPNERVKAFVSIETYKQGNLLTGSQPPEILDHTGNTGIHEEGGITNKYLSTASVSGTYSYITENGDLIQLVDNGNDQDGFPKRNVLINGKSIDNIPSYGISSIQSIQGFYDVIQTDGNPIGINVKFSSGNTIFTISEIGPDGSIVNSRDTQPFSITANNLKGFSLVRQCLDQSFTYASAQYIGCFGNPSANQFKIYDENGISVSSASISTQPTSSIFCCKFFGKVEFVINFSGNTTYTLTSTTATNYNFQYAIMQSLNGYNRVLLTGINQGGTTSSYFSYIGFTSFTSSYTLAPTLNTTTNSPNDGYKSCGYGYSNNLQNDGNAYYSNLSSISTGLDTLASSNGPVRTYGRLSSVSTSQPFEFRIIVTPGKTLQGTNVANVPSDVQSFISVGMIGSKDALTIALGVPLTAVGDADVSYSPCLGPSAGVCPTSIIWKTNGYFIFLKISISLVNPIQKITKGLYKINSISPVNIVDTVNAVLELGSNDWNGACTVSGYALDPVTTNMNLILYGKYANSVDAGYAPYSMVDYSTSISPIGAFIPKCHFPKSSSYIYMYIQQGGLLKGGPYYRFDRVLINGVHYYINGGPLNSLVNYINQYPTYSPNPTLPIPLGATFSGRSITTNSSATSLAFNETYITGGYPGTTVTIQSDYDGYLLGNQLPFSSIVFTLYSTNYVFDGKNIYQINFVSNVAQLPLQKVVAADGLTFIATSPTSAYFISKYDNSLWIFDGSRNLTKVRKFNLLGAITNGQFNVRDNTLLLDSASNWIFVRDGLITVNSKLASQPASGGRLYDTVNGLYVGTDSALWQYGYNPNAMTIPSGATGSTAVQTIDWQSAYFGLGGNRISRELDYYVCVYSLAKVKTSLTVTVYSFDQDERKGFVFQNPQPAIVNINPADYDDGGFYRFSVSPKFAKTLASSIRIQCNSKIAIQEVVVRYDDEGIDAVYSPGRRAIT